MLSDAKFLPRRLALAGLVLSALAACSPTEQQSETLTATQQAIATPTGEPAPEVFAATAWRVLAADGARYTTYLDQDGTYRDLRNGDPWQTGSWRYSEEEGSGKRLCLRPDDENGVERCWEPDRMRNGVMRAEHDAGTVIELESVTYALPVETADEAA